MTRHIITAIILIAAVSCACQRKSKTTDETSVEFYSGRFIPDANGRPSFVDCATRVTMDIDINKGYEILRRQYNDLEGPNENEVFIEFTGKTKRQAGTTIPEVSVDSVLKIQKDGNCVSDFILPGIYQPETTNKDTEETHGVLRLKPDYTYVYTSFGDNKSETTKTGTWHRSSLSILVLRGDTTNGETETFQIIPVRESISRNSGGKPQTFKKVYL